MQCIVEGKFDDAAARMDETMQKLVPADKLAEVWDDQIKKYGAWKAVERVRQRKVGARQVVELTCELERGRIVVRLSYDQDMRVGGLFFRPAPPTSHPANSISVETESGMLYGSIDLPDGPGPFPVLLVVAGSGPTDRDGNSGLTKNDCLKKLGHALSRHGMAVVRFDKRGVGESLLAAGKEEDLRIETMVSDVEAWLRKLRSDPRFDKVGIVGHSEGALLATLAAEHVPVDALVLLAAAGRPADELFREQLVGKLSEEDQAANERILEQLKKGRLVAEVPSRLHALYRPSVQPYVISWFQYDPAVELAKLRVPTLIVQGRKDIQVKVSDAENLSKARPDARMVVIDDMNHVLKRVRNDAEQSLSYVVPVFPLAERLVPEIVTFLADQAHFRIKKEAETK